MRSSDNNVVFFDAECVLCSNFLQLLLKIDKKKRLRFARLQSQYSKEVLPEELVNDIDYKTVAFLKNGTIYSYSDAVIEVFKTLGFPWSIFIIGKILPKAIRDRLYSFVSEHRYSWFGKSDSCMIPSKELEERFVKQQ